MDQEEFYRDQYYRTIDTKNEINNSLSIPIGIITALVAALFYALTTYDFSHEIVWCNIIFSFFALASIILLGYSTYRLILSFSDFHNGYNYAYLADANDLDIFHTGLLGHYNSLPNANQTGSIQLAKNDFDEYLLKELINAAGINQKNNKTKIYERYVCHQFMIYALISLSVLTVPFGINFSLKKDKSIIQKVELISDKPISFVFKEKETTKLLNLDTIYHGNSRTTKTDTATNSNDKRRCRP